MPHEVEAMSTRLKLKIAALVAVVIVCFVGTGLLLSSVQTKLSVSSYTEEMRHQNEQLKTTLEQADKETEESTSSFDEIFQAKADSISFMAHNNAGFEVSDTKMSEYKQLFDVDDVLVVSKDGQILAKAQDTKADFTHARFNQLRTVFSEENPTTAMEVTVSSQEWNERYYSSKIDDETMAVLEVSPKRLDDIIEDNSSLKATLKDITVGQHGYVMAVSAQDYTVQYHPDSSLIGTDALDDGLSVDDLEDGHFFHMTFNGTRLYSGVTKIGKTYYISSVLEKTLTASRNITVGVVLFAFGVVMAAVVLYGVFVLRDDERQGHIEEDYAPFGPVLYSKKIGSKAAVLSVVGLVVVIIVSFYMQTLFALSNESLVNTDRANSIAQTTANTSKRAEALRKEGDTRYLSKAKITAYILDQNPELENRASLLELAKVLKVDVINVFNIDGVRTASTDPSPSFTLSDDTKSQSYAFRKLLQSSGSLVQEAREDENGTMRQYIGVTTTDEQGLTDGLVQIAVSPKMLEELLSSVKIDRVLDGVKVGGNGFAFAIDKETGKIAYFPDSLVQGKKATDVGLKDDQIKGGYCNYLTIDGTQYYVSSVETEDYYLYVTRGDSELMDQRVRLTIDTGIEAFVCLVVIFLLLSFDLRKKAAAVQAEAESAAGANNNGGGEGSGGGSGDAGKAQPVVANPADQRIFDIQRPGTNRTMKTQSAASRWLRQSFKWDEKTPEGKLGTVLRWLFGLFVVLVFVGVVFKDTIFGSQSVFSYILGGGWSKGMNIFAVTAALMTACVIATVASAANELLRLLSGVVGARGETIIRLLCSIIKYGSVIGVLYYSLSLLGVDTATLLASAGLLTLAIGFGAQALVSDILSGLFIIFEGEFRVGDMIQVGTMGGTVIEIGVRTTKINDGLGNVLVLRNSQISNVMNKTKMDSYASVEFNLINGESLPYLENMLHNELPNVKKRLPSIVSGPFYKGVVALSDSATTVRIVATCAEQNRVQLERDLKREVKLLMSRYDIAPYQQSITHEQNKPKETAKDKREQATADRFNEEQKESAKLIGNNNEDSD
ncbi:mechanosensitive ion channel domain-containing protein [Bifidobacterium panos]|uniref:Small-conductance mechanosensitive channel n=1 Tax=Bifidobacterium panos TaxID=2675321 RepID=A0ABX1SXM5_9BIFI|nr:mechanosensitive ion channel domain-containing protein [Bifidobacterium sp. DSM 109963]NMN02110.1 Small-conductance mechanosensitive channel [Bifidobacterium sp. DSM 109963]